MSKLIEAIVREAIEADLRAILDLAGQPGMDDGAVLDIETARTIFQKMMRYPFYRLFVAVRGHDVVGTYALLVMDNLGHLGTPSAVVEQVLVSPAAQGRGIGKTMMHHAMAQAEAAGCYKLVLSSNIKRVEAHKFYDGLGFIRHGLSFRVDLDAGCAA